MQFQTKLFIGGEFVDAQDRGRIEVLNPHDNSVLAGVSEAPAADFRTGVAAASKAVRAGRDAPAADRGRLLLKLADAFEGRRPRI